MEWIDVEKMLPGNGVFIIIAFTSNHDVYILYKNSDQWCLIDDETGLPSDNVNFTHWIPLPELPEV